MPRLDDLPLESLRRIERVCEDFEQQHGLDSDIANGVTGFAGVERAVLVGELIRIDLELRQTRGWDTSPERYAHLSTGDLRACETALRDFAKSDTRLGTSKNYPANSSGSPDGHPRIVSGVPVQSGRVVSGDWPYKLIRVIGAGGMGKVYLAQQTAPVERLVALKVVDSATPTPEILERFDLERQSLAVMDHNSIAKVFDAGKTERGQPFFSMELVEGSEITKFCDDRKLTIGQRLNLFVQTCRAVQHAHQKGIIHRDLKPSNVMVTLADGQPVVKVIDFGLAKAIHGASLPKPSALQTQQGQVMGTLAYMSPEQAALDTTNLDTRADVYSLGALLFELLVGTTPILKSRLQSNSFLDALSLVRTEDPPRPSVRFSERPATKASIAKQRRCGESYLQRILTNDLDWIALKTLEKEPSRRYDTPSALAEDVLRFVRGDAVAASPPSARYRLVKAYGKHKLIFHAVAAVMAVLLLGLVGTAGMWWRAVGAETLASQSARSATRESQNARAAEAEQRAARKLAQDERDRALRAEASVERTNSRMNYHLAVARWESGRAAEANEYLDRTAATDRNVEWYIAKHQFHGSDMSCYGHNFPVVSVATSGDGKYFASVDYASAILWDANTGLQLWSGAGSDCVRFSPDGSKLAFSRGSQAVEIVDIATREGQLIRGDGGRISCLAWSPDGATMVIGNANGSLSVCDVDSGTIVEGLTAFSSPVDLLTFHPSGKQFAASSSDEGIVFWDAQTRQQVRRLEGHKVRTVGFAFSPDGTRFVSTGRDGYFFTLRMLDVKTQAEIWSLRGPVDDFVNSVSFSPDGGRLVTAEHNKMVKIRSAASGEVIHTLQGHLDGVATACFNHDGSRVISGGYDDTVKSWDAIGGSGMRYIRRQGLDTVSDLQIDSSGEFIATAGSSVRIWNSRAGESLQNMGVRSRTKNTPLISNLTWQPDTTRLLAIVDGRLMMWEAVQGELLGAFVTGPASVTSAVFSSDGRSIAAACTDDTVVTFATATRERTGVFEMATPGIVGLAFLEGDQQLLAASSQGTITVWDTKTQGLARRFETKRAVDSIEVGGGKLLATTNYRSNGIEIWDVQTGRPLATLLGHDANVSGIEFDVSARRLFSSSADKTLRVWDVQTGEELLSIAQKDELRSIDIAPDMSYVAFGTQYGSLVVIDVMRGEESRVLAGHSDTINAVWINQSETRLYSESIAKKIVWSTATGEQILDAEWGVPELKRVELSTKYRAKILGKNILLVDANHCKDPIEQAYRTSKTRPSADYYAIQQHEALKRKDVFAQVFLGVWQADARRGTVRFGYMSADTVRLAKTLPAEQARILQPLLERLTQE